MSFEDDITQAIKSKIISDIHKIAFTKIDYKSQQTIPAEFINSVWADVDWTAVLIEIKQGIQTRICNSVIANMETEMKTDIKKLLSIDGVRQKLRVEIYPKLMQVLDGR